MLGPIYLSNNGSSNFGSYFYPYGKNFSFTMKFKMRARQASILANIICTTDTPRNDAYLIGIDSSYHPYIYLTNKSQTPATCTFSNATLWADTEYTLSITQNNTSGYSFTFTLTTSSGTTTQTVTSSFNQFYYGVYNDGSATFGDSNIDILSVTLTGVAQSALSTKNTLTFTESNCTGLTFTKAISGVVSTTYTWTIDNYATVKYYNGSSWVRCQVQYYNGTAWKICVPMYYDGSSWKYLVNI